MAKKSESAKGGSAKVRTQIERTVTDEEAKKLERSAKGEAPTTSDNELSSEERFTQTLQDPTFECVVDRVAPVHLKTGTIEEFPLPTTLSHIRDETARTQGGGRFRIRVTNRTTGKIESGCGFQIAGKPKTPAGFEGDEEDSTLVDMDRQIKLAEKKRRLDELKASEEGSSATKLLEAQITTLTAKIEAMSNNNNSGNDITAMMTAMNEANRQAQERMEKQQQIDRERAREETKESRERADREAREAREASDKNMQLQMTMMQNQNNMLMKSMEVQASNTKEVNVEAARRAETEKSSMMQMFTAQLEASKAQAEVSAAGEKKQTDFMIKMLDLQGAQSKKPMEDALGLIQTVSSMVAGNTPVDKDPETLIGALTSVVKEAIPLARDVIQAKQEAATQATEAGGEQPSQETQMPSTEEMAAIAKNAVNKQRADLEAEQAAQSETVGVIKEPEVPARPVQNIQEQSSAAPIHQATQYAPQASQTPPVQSPPSVQPPPPANSTAHPNNRRTKVCTETVKLILSEIGDRPNRCEWVEMMVDDFPDDMLAHIRTLDVELGNDGNVNMQKTMTVVQSLYTLLHPYTGTAILMKLAEKLQEDPQNAVWFMTGLGAVQEIMAEAEEEAPVPPASPAPVVQPPPAAPPPSVETPPPATQTQDVESPQDVATAQEQAEDENLLAAAATAAEAVVGTADPMTGESDV